MIIINADDFGKNNTVNKAVTEAFNKGYINQTTIMTNMSGYDEAVEMAKKNGFFDKIGIHLNLDEGVPLTERIKGNKNFCDKNEVFNGRFKQKKGHAFFMSKEDKECLREEIYAQFKKYIESGFTLMHIDSHHHNHVRYSVLKLMIPIAKQYDFKSCRLSRNIYTDSSKPSPPRSIYKVLVNRLIRKNFKTTDYFGSYSEWNANRDKTQTSTIEVMVHPTYHEGKLVDRIGKDKYGDIVEYLY